MSRKPAEKLNMLQSSKLLVLIEADFVSLDKTDEEYAKYASEKLGFSVNADHIATRRRQLGIERKRPVAVAGDLLALSERVEALERQHAADEKEHVGLSTVILEMRHRLDLIEKALRLKGQFEGFRP